MIAIKYDNVLLAYLKKFKKVGLLFQNILFLHIYLESVSNTLTLLLK